MRSSTTLLPSILVFLISISFCMEWGSSQNIIPNSPNPPNPFDVGVILDMGTWVGNISWGSISMAIDDFYAAHPNHITRLVLHLKDSKEDVVSAASAALSLLKNLQVQAIIGPQTSAQAKFISKLGNKSQTPIISFSATSPFLSSPLSPYFIQTAVSDSAQAKAIVALVQSVRWTELILISEDSEYGIGMITYLIDAFQTAEVRIPYRSMISLGANDDQILHELNNLKTRQTHVFVVHASYSLASRLLLKAKETGMMGEGYDWIVTYGLIHLMNFMDSSTIDAINGILTVKPYIPKSKVGRNFNNRWRERFCRENPISAAKCLQPSIYALWAYDTAWALAMAAENLNLGKSMFLKLGPNVGDDHQSELEQLVPQPNGPSLLNFISGVKFKGVSGQFQLVRGQRTAMKFEIINIIAGKNKRIGIWTKKHGMSRKLESKTSLEREMQTGNSMALPKVLKPEITRKKLLIGVPVENGFKEFANEELNPLTKRNGSGLFIEVFDMVVRMPPYDIQYEYVFFWSGKGDMDRRYDDLIYQVYLQKFDAVVGYVTITPNRSLYVDFTVPYTEPGMSMVVPIKDDRSAWTFIKPLTTDLWLATGAFFIYTGFVVWVLEHRINDSFRGPPLHQLGTTLYFSFSTMVFAHKERLISNFTKVVMIIWLFVVLILTSSYTASLSSMLTVQQLHPTFTSVQEIIKKGDYIGYSGDYFKLRSLNIDMSRAKSYETAEEYDEAMTKGSAGGGISAMIAEIPYIRVFLSKYCGKYTMVGDVYKSDGIGFVFPKGSPLVPDISREILKLQVEIDKKLAWNEATCSGQDNSATSTLSFDSFWGLFLITGLTSTFALTVFLIFFLYEHRHMLLTNNPGRYIWQRLAIALNY